MKFLVTLIALVLIPLPAMAYIDPSSGSAIMSALIGFFVAISLAIKTYWYKLKSLFTGGKKKENNDDADEKKETES